MRPKFTKILFLLSVATTFLAVKILFKICCCQTPNTAADICMQSPTECVPPLRSFEKNFRVAPGFKLNICKIEKNLSTVMTAIVCFLFDGDRFRMAKRKINTEIYSRRFCGTRNEATSIDQLAFKFNTSHRDIVHDWMHLAVVRDPIERFISAFVDKCVLEKTWRDHPRRCNGCRTNLSCFVELQHERMMRRGWNGERLNSFDDRHFNPQNWRCHFDNYFHLFTFIRYSSDQQGSSKFFSELFTLLRSIGVQEGSIESIRNQTLMERTRHSTNGKKQRKLGEALLRQNSRLMRMLIQMYYYDFVLFGYAIPSI